VKTAGNGEASKKKGKCPMQERTTRKQLLRKSRHLKEKAAGKVESARTRNKE